jgi:glycosyltransferase involved in cell wall biosynthesis
MFCSTIIPTVGRDTLTRAVESVLCQSIPSSEMEVIVVNDSGRSLPHSKWHESPHVHHVQTNKLERSVARNTGATIAKGRFLHFLDDDDWLAPNAFRHLRELTSQGGASLVYGSSQLVDRQGDPLIKLHHRLQGNCFLPVMAGEWIPLQASLIDSKAFFTLGGFNPLLTGPEDIDLLRRLTLSHDITGTEHLVSNIEIGELGSTTNYTKHSLQSRFAREQILDEPAVFNRLFQSTCLQSTSDISGWYGRIVRIYLTSALWNCQKHRLLMACSRILYASAAISLSGIHVLSRSFWHSVSHPYASETFARGHADVRQRKYTRQLVN